MSDLGLDTPPGSGQGVMRSSPLTKELREDVRSRTWHPPGSRQGVMRSPPLTEELQENVQYRTWHPSWFRTGGDEEPPLNRGVTGECSISDLTPFLAQDRG
jgi:hypothetical protein